MTKDNFFIDAVNSLARGKHSSCYEPGIVTWKEDATDIPTSEEIDAEVIRLKAEYDALEYSRNREEEFPSIQDLVVALYDTDDKSAVEAKRAAVKAKYPKPS